MYRQYSTRFFFFFSSRRRHTRCSRDWSSDVCSSDLQEWRMTAPTVNATYSASYNDITFPAGILQAPFFDPDADDAVNYGGMGAVIGHEMTHGFDDQGRQFDAAGHPRRLWGAEDGPRLQEAASLGAPQVV